MRTLTVSKPKLCDGSIVRAHAEAIELGEPVLWSTRIFADDRGWSLMNQMQGILSPEGQVNYSCQYPGVIKAWHRHALQTDFWLCVSGHIKAGVHCSERDQSWSLVMGEKNPCVLVIPPGLWHGAATVGPAPAGLLYYVTHAYNASQPDEERLEFDAVPDFPWEVQHG